MWAKPQRAFLDSWLCSSTWTIHQRRLRQVYEVWAENIACSRARQQMSTSTANVGTALLAGTRRPLVHVEDHRFRKKLFSVLACVAGKDRAEGNSSLQCSDVCTAQSQLSDCSCGLGRGSIPGRRERCRATLCPARLAGPPLTALHRP